MKAVWCVPAVIPTVIMLVSPRILNPGLSGINKFKELEKSGVSMKVVFCAAIILKQSSVLNRSQKTKAIKASQQYLCDMIRLAHILLAQDQAAVSVGTHFLPTKSMAVEKRERTRVSLLSIDLYTSCRLPILCYYTNTFTSSVSAVIPEPFIMMLEHKGKVHGYRHKLEQEQLVLLCCSHNVNFIIILISGRL